MHWPDLGPNWRQQAWHLVPIDAARGASCLHELLHPTYVLIMTELFDDLHQRPHGLLEVAGGDRCHVIATVLPARINLPILREILQPWCRRGWPIVRCVGTHNGAQLTEELRDCASGFYVQMMIAGVAPALVSEMVRGFTESCRLLHLDYQTQLGEQHLYKVLWHLASHCSQVV